LLGNGFFVIFLLFVKDRFSLLVLLGNGFFVIFLLLVKSRLFLLFALLTSFCLLLLELFLLFFQCPLLFLLGLLQIQSGGFFQGSFLLVKGRLFLLFNLLQFGRLLTIKFLLLLFQRVLFFLSNLLFFHLFELCLFGFLLSQRIGLFPRDFLSQQTLRLFLLSPFQQQCHSFFMCFLQVHEGLEFFGVILQGFFLYFKVFRENDTAAQAIAGREVGGLSTAGTGGQLVRLTGIVSFLRRFGRFLFDPFLFIDVKGNAAVGAVF